MKKSIFWLWKGNITPIIMLTDGFFFFLNRNSLKEKRNLHSWTYNWTNFKPCQSSIRRMEEYMSLQNNIDYGPGQCLGLFLASHQTQKQCAADFLLWSMFSDTAKRRNEAQLTKGKMWKESKLFLTWEERSTLTGWNKQQHWMGSIYGTIIIWMLLW